jgi:hypothetical protein
MALRKARVTNPCGWGVIDKRGKFVKDGKRAIPALPKTTPCTGRVSMADVGYAQCRFTGELPPLVTVDTPIYCGVRTNGGSWCAVHDSIVFDRRR